MSVVPSVLAGCWKRTSSGGSVPYLKISEGGPYHVSDGRLPYEITSDGQVLTWQRQRFSRIYGSGQNILGVWRVGANEYYFRDNRSYTYQDQTSEIPGVFDTLGDDTGGELIEWQRRAVISSAVDNGDGSFAVTAYSVFGGTYSFTMLTQGVQLQIISELGNITEYDPVDCSSLA